MARKVQEGKRKKEFRKLKKSRGRKNLEDYEKAL